LVLEPIFEADLQPEQYAYRPERSGLEAVRRVQRLVIEGHTEVVDADLSGYFDSVPHAELMKSVARRVSDGSVLALIKAWLEAPVEELDECGHKQRTTRNKDEGRGTPQGAPLSPLLANVYMRRFILGWKTLGHEQQLDAHIVNYADDFVICCRGTALAAEAAMRDMMRRLKLTVNDQKTRVCQAWDEPFDFLGYTIGRCYRERDGSSYMGVKPSARKVQALCREISELTAPRWCGLSLKEMVVRLNQKVGGWANYFCMGTVRRVYGRVQTHLHFRLRQWWHRKHPTQGARQCPSGSYLHDELGLLRLQRRPDRLSWANA
jgi:group II intron reverse transcriptase/maturase